MRVCTVSIETPSTASYRGENCGLPWPLLVGVTLYRAIWLCWSLPTVLISGCSSSIALPTAIALEPRPSRASRAPPSPLIITFLPSSTTFALFQALRSCSCWCAPLFSRRPEVYIKVGFRRLSWSCSPITPPSQAPHNTRRGSPEHTHKLSSTPNNAHSATPYHASNPLPSQAPSQTVILSQASHRRSPSRNPGLPRPL